MCNGKGMRKGLPVPATMSDFQVIFVYLPYKHYSYDNQPQIVFQVMGQYYQYTQYY